MNASYALTDCVLSSNDAEHERLAKQADTLAPYMKRLLLNAGGATRQRVLDVGWLNAGDRVLGVRPLTTA